MRAVDWFNEAVLAMFATLFAAIGYLYKTKSDKDDCETKLANKASKEQVEGLSAMLKEVHTDVREIRQHVMRDDP